MKKLMTIIGLAALALPAFSQTNTPTENPFYQQAFQWLTSIDTNNNTTFVSTRGFMDTGVESSQNSGVPINNYIGLSFDVVSSTNSPIRLDLNAMERDSGVQGTFVSGQGGIGVGYVIHDVRLDLIANGGYYNFNPDTRNKVFGEIQVNIKKALGTHTFAEIGLAEQFPHSERLFRAGIGFSF